MATTGLHRTTVNNYTWNRNDVGDVCIAELLYSTHFTEAVLSEQMLRIVYC